MADLWEIGCQVILVRALGSPCTMHPAGARNSRTCRGDREVASSNRCQFNHIGIYMRTPATPVRPSYCIARDMVLPLILLLFVADVLARHQGSRRVANSLLPTRGPKAWGLMSRQDPLPSWSGAALPVRVYFSDGLSHSKRSITGCPTFCRARSTWSLPRLSCRDSSVKTERPVLTLLLLTWDLMAEGVAGTCCGLVYEPLSIMVRSPTAVSVG